MAGGRTGCPEKIILISESPRENKSHGLQHIRMCGLLVFHYGLWRLAVPVVLMEDSRFRTFL